jgi:hypothetical protein
MEYGRYRRKFFKKYYYNLDKHLQELEGYNDVNSDYWEVASTPVKVNIDNKPNIRKWNDSKNRYDFYSLNSKHWSQVDPIVDDDKSIQHRSLERLYVLTHNKKTKEYEFPTMPLYNGDSFYDTKFRLLYSLSYDEFKVYFEEPYPTFHITRDFHDYEKDDPKNKGLNGVRTYYYEANHYRSPIKIIPNLKHPYDNYVFATKRNIANYINKNYWEAVIGSLHEK